MGLCRVVERDRGAIPMGDIIIGTMCAALCCNFLLQLQDLGTCYLFCRLCVSGTAVFMRYVVSITLSVKVMSGRLLATVLSVKILWF